MSDIRRWYFYVVSAVSLQAVVWAVIALLRNLLLPLVQAGGAVVSAPVERIAFQIAVIFIGLPMFLLHWRWAGREEAARDRAGPPSLERAIYHYFMLSAFLIPFLTNAAGFSASVIRLLSGTPQLRYVFRNQLPDRANLIYTGTAVAILAVLLLWQRRLLRQDRQERAISPAAGLLHALFLYLFAAGGLLTAGISAANVIADLLVAFNAQPPLITPGSSIASLAALIVGTLYWLFFWLNAQKLARQGGWSKNAALVRSIYLYLVIFLAVLSSVGAASTLLAGLLRRLLDLPPHSGGGLVAGTLLTAAVIWVYHALVLREEYAVAQEGGRAIPLSAEEAGVRRLYWYLVAGIGLLALLTGLGGLLGLLFDSGSYVAGRQGEQLAWFTAAVLAGLAVWAIPWRKIQQETAAPPPAGTQARDSVVRRFYLFFFLLLATLTFLIAAIFLLSRLLTLLLGEPLPPGELRSLGLAAAFALLAGLVWLYHGFLLRQDQRLLDALLAAQTAAATIVVVDDGDGRLGRRLISEIERAVQGAHVIPIGLTASAAAAMGQDAQRPPEQTLAAAGIIIGPWSMAAPHAGLGADESIPAAIAASPARKLILPRPTPGWQWAGAEAWDEESAVRQAAQAVEELLAGEGVRQRRAAGPGMILLLLAATLIILILIANLLDSVLPLF